MVQREIADRLRAGPGSRVYGAPSVLVQLACEVELLRARGSRGLPAAPAGGLGAGAARAPRARRAAGPRGLVRDAFAHRRKAAGRLAGARAGGPSGARAGGARASSASPRTPGPRRCPRRTSLALAAEAGERMTLRAPAKLNLCLYLGPAPRGRAARDPLPVLPAHPGRPDRRRRGASGDEVVCPGVEGPNLAAARWRRFARGLERAAAEGRDREADPGRGRARRRQRGRGRDPAAGRGRGRRGSEQVAAELGADVPSQLEPAFALVARRRRGGRAAAAAGGVRGRAGARRRRASAPRRSTRRPTGWGSGGSRQELERLAERLREAAGAGASPLEYAELLVNDLAGAALSLRPEIGGALAALDEVGAPRRRSSPGRGRPPSACSRTSSRPTAPPRRYRRAIAGAIVAAPEEPVSESGEGLSPEREEGGARADERGAQDGGRSPPAADRGRRLIARVRRPQPRAAEHRPPAGARGRLVEARRLHVRAGRAGGLPRDGRLRRPGPPGRDRRHPRRRGRWAGARRRSC